VLKETLGLPGEVLVEGQDIPQTLKAKTRARENEQAKENRCTCSGLGAV
jgi:hypothetical protein